MKKQQNARVLVAMSGGVDSAVAAYILQTQGYECIGVTLLLRDGDAAIMNDISDAQQTAEKLGIPHHVADCSAIFEQHVVRGFVQGYMNGVTPNPCVVCNRHIKFGALWQLAEAFDAAFLATGHYARTERIEATNRIALKKALCAEKDQSYVLYNLTEKMLERVLLPLGKMSKDEVRNIARKQGFDSAEKKESQDICFIPEGGHAAFIEKYTGLPHEEGDFVDTSGRVLGKHRGLANYTVGQRKGLGIVLHKPTYVLAKDAKTNTVVLGDAEELLVSTFEAASVNWLTRTPEDGPFTAAVKIRYRHTAAAATLTPRADHFVRVTFNEPQRGVAPGQAAVFYEGETVVGGGTIC